MSDEKASISFLEELHGAVARAFMERIENGEAKSADLAAAVKFLADNGIKQIQTDDTTKLKEDLKRLLPFKSPAQLAEEDGIIN